MTRTVYTPRARGGWRARIPAIRRLVEKYDRPWRLRRRARRRRLRLLALAALALSVLVVLIR